MYPQLKRKSPKPPKQPSRYLIIIKRLLIWGSALFIIAMLAAIGTVFGVIRHFSHDLPSIESLKNYRPPLVTTVYADDGRKIAEFAEEKRIVVPLSQLPKTLLQAFVAAEDSRFYIHKGIDVIGIFRAFLKNLRAGAMVQGGSTITQQVVKSFLLTPERSYRRKIREAILAYRIDNFLTKEEVLFLYLNQIYLGHGAYGVEVAAQTYFGKTARNLNLAECAMLAGLPQAPSRYSPVDHPFRAKERQIYTLRRMLEEGYITDAEHQKAANMSLDIGNTRPLRKSKSSFYTEHVRR
ncbi:MAG: penicillin-binding protein, partial [Desulfobacteraceae bacterium]|nr:penicillin-binding protein [Desulfobacteraceae bacterium]